jgi:hypothetical protein
MRGEQRGEQRIRELAEELQEMRERHEALVNEAEQRDNDGEQRQVEDQGRALTETETETTPIRSPSITTSDASVQTTATEVEAEPPEAEAKAHTAAALDDGDSGHELSLEDPLLEGPTQTETQTQRQSPVVMGTNLPLNNEPMQPLRGILITPPPEMEYEGEAAGSGGANKNDDASVVILEEGADEGRSEALYIRPRHDPPPAPATSVIVTNPGDSYDNHDQHLLLLLLLYHHSDEMPAALVVSADPDNRPLMSQSQSQSLGESQSQSPWALLDQMRTRFEQERASLTAQVEAQRRRVAQQEQSERQSLREAQSERDELARALETAMSRLTAANYDSENTNSNINSNSNSVTCGPVSRDDSVLVTTGSNAAVERTHHNNAGETDEGQLGQQSTQVTASSQTEFNYEVSLYEQQQHHEQRQELLLVELKQRLTEQQVDRNLDRCEISQGGGHRLCIRPPHLSLTCSHPHGSPVMSCPACFITYLSAPTIRSCTDPSWTRYAPATRPR